MYRLPWRPVRCLSRNRVRRCDDGNGHTCQTRALLQFGKDFKAVALRGVQVEENGVRYKFIFLRGRTEDLDFSLAWRRHALYCPVSTTTTPCSERRCTASGGVLPSPGYVKTYNPPFRSTFIFAANPVRQTKSCGRLTTA